MNWPTGAGICGHNYSTNERGQSETTCERSVLEGHDRCPYHLDESTDQDIDLEADFTDRLEGLASGALNEHEEPLQFHGVELGQVTLSELDLTDFEVRNVTLDLRGSRIDELILTDSVLPFTVDLRNATIGRIQITGGVTAETTIKKINLSHAEIGGDPSLETATVDDSVHIKNQTGDELLAENCDIRGSVKILGSDYNSLSLAKSHTGAEFALSNTQVTSLELRQTTVGTDKQGKVTVLSDGIGNLDATGIECAQIHIKAPGIGDTQTQLTDISLPGATVGTKIYFEKITVKEIDAAGLETDHLYLDDVTFGSDPDRSGNESPGLSCSGADITEIRLDGVGPLERVDLGEIRAKTVEITDGTYGTLDITDGSLEQLEVKTEIAELSLDQVEITRKATINTTSSDTATISVSECELTTCDFDVADGSVCIEKSEHTSKLTIAGKALESVELLDTSVPEIELALRAAVVRADTLRSVNTFHFRDKCQIERVDLIDVDANTLSVAELTASGSESTGPTKHENSVFAVVDSEFRDIEYRGQVNHLLFTRSKVSEAIAVTDSRTESLWITDCECRRLAVSGTIHDVRIQDSACSQDSAFELYDTDHPLRNIRLSDSRFAGLTFDLDGASVDCELHRCYVERTLKFDDCTVRNITIENTELRRLTADALTVDSIELHYCPVDSELSITGTATEVVFNRVESEGRTAFNARSMPNRIRIRDCSLANTVFQHSTDDPAEQINDESAPSVHFTTTQTRIDGRLKVGNLIADKFTIDNTNCNTLEFGGWFGTVEITDSQITEETTAKSADIETLQLRKSHIPRLDLTSDSPLPVARHIEIEQSSLPNATIASREEATPIAEEEFIAKRSSLRGAFLERLSAGNTINFEDVNLTDALLENARLEGANLSSSLLSRADLAGAKFGGANLSGTVFGDAQITSDTNFTDKDGYIVHDPRFQSATETEIEADPVEAKTVYKRLEALASSSGQSRLAREMHKNRKEMSYRTSANETGVIARVSRGVNGIWNITTGYGIGPRNVIASGLVVITAFWLVYAAGAVFETGFSVANIVNAFPYSAGVFFNLRPDFFEVHGLFRLLPILQTAIGALLIAILVYTIGQRASL